MKPLRRSLLGFILSFLTLTGCQKDPADGHFTVKMTDSPGNYAALHLTVEKAEAYLQNSGWVTLSVSPRSFDVLELTNGRELVLANRASASVGTYTRLRLTFGSNGQLTLYQDGSYVNAAVSVKRSLELTINKSVKAGAEVSVLLDFDVAQSVIEQANGYVVEPVISIIQDAATGIAGEIEGGIRAAVEVSNGIIRITTYTDANGKFLIRGLQEGIYQVKVMLPDRPDLPKEIIISNTVVTKGKITQMGKIKISG